MNVTNFFLLRFVGLLGLVENRKGRLNRNVIEFLFSFGSRRWATSGPAPSWGRRTTNGWPASVAWRRPPAARRRRRWWRHRRRWPRRRRSSSPAALTPVRLYYFFFQINTSIGVCIFFIRLLISDLSVSYLNSVRTKSYFRVTPSSLLPDRFNLIPLILLARFGFHPSCLVSIVFSAEYFGFLPKFLSYFHISLLFLCSRLLGFSSLCTIVYLVASRLGSWVIF